MYCEFTIERAQNFQGTNFTIDIVFLLCLIMIVSRLSEVDLCVCVCILYSTVS